MLVGKNKCYGCGVCENVCKRGACKMISDEEGFLYPNIDDKECTQCGECEKHCPAMISINKAFEYNTKSWCGHYKSDKYTMKCASGGAATALSEVVISKGGSVYGVVYNEDFTKTMHTRVVTLKDLKRLRGSKYTQSDKRRIYEQVKSDLKQLPLVLYIGTPCEIGALKTYLGKQYDNLITCELICQGIMSPEVQKLFVKGLKKKYKSDIISFSARYKLKEWAPAYIKVKFANGKTYCKLAHYTDYGLAHSVFYRPSCYTCKFKGENRVADITVGDCWGIPRESELWNKAGLSIIMAHSKSAEYLVASLTDFELHEIDYTDYEGNNPYLNKCIPEKSTRGKFSRIMNNQGLAIAAIKTQPISRIVKRVIYNIYPKLLDR